MVETDPNLQDAAQVIDLFRRAADANLATPGRGGALVELPAQGEVILTGDLHDSPLNFLAILQLADLDDSPDRHVVFHEVIHGERRVNGNDLSYRTLARIAALKVRHPARVHQILSNHEVAQLTGDGILKDGVSVVEAFHHGLIYVFGDRWESVDTAIRDYIRTMPLAVRTPHGVLCAHSLPSPRHRDLFNPCVLTQPLTDADFESPDGSVHLMIWGRGLAQTVADELAKAWGVSLFVLGHQHADMGFEPVGQTMLVINSDHEHGVALPIDLSRAYTRNELIESLVPLNSVY